MISCIFNLIVFYSYMEWKIEAEICAGFALFFTCMSMSTKRTNQILIILYPLQL